MQELLEAARILAMFGGEVSFIGAILWLVVIRPLEAAEPVKTDE